MFIIFTISFKACGNFKNPEEPFRWPPFFILIKFAFKLFFKKVACSKVTALSLSP
jgi:hypothetical protein